MTQKQVKENEADVGRDADELADTTDNLSMDHFENYQSQSTV